MRLEEQTSMYVMNTQKKYKVVNDRMMMMMMIKSNAMNNNK